MDEDLTEEEGPNVSSKCHRGLPPVIKTRQCIPRKCKNVQRKRSFEQQCHCNKNFVTKKACNRSLSEAVTSHDALISSPSDKLQGFPQETTEGHSSNIAGVECSLGSQQVLQYNLFGKNFVQGISSTEDIQKGLEDAAKLTDRLRQMRDKEDGVEIEKHVIIKKEIQEEDNCSIPETSQQLYNIPSTDSLQRIKVKDIRTLTNVEYLAESCTEITPVLTPTSISQPVAEITGVSAPNQPASTKETSVIQTAERQDALLNSQNHEQLVRQPPSATSTQLPQRDIQVSPSSSLTTTIQPPQHNIQVLPLNVNHSHPGQPAHVHPTYEGIGPSSATMNQAIYAETNNIPSSFPAAQQFKNKSLQNAHQQQHTRSAFLPASSNQHYHSAQMHNRWPTTDQQFQSYPLDQQFRYQNPIYYTNSAFPQNYQPTYHNSMLQPYPTYPNQRPSILQLYPQQVRRCEYPSWRPMSSFHGNLLTDHTEEPPLFNSYHYLNHPQIARGLLQQRYHLLPGMQGDNSLQQGSSGMPETIPPYLIGDCNQSLVGQVGDHSPMQNPQKLQPFPETRQNQQFNLSSLSTRIQSCQRTNLAGGQGMKSLAAQQEVSSSISENQPSYQEQDQSDQTAVPCVSNLQETVQGQPSIVPPVHTAVLIEEEPVLHQEVEMSQGYEKNNGPCCFMCHNRAILFCPCLGPCYCSKECQIAHWIEEHMEVCPKYPDNELNIQ